ncbi:hypothetical protein [Acinetobacter sp. YH12023]|uniref:hypothetical protein n=1 Tax=Acinetobacter sp. YH12023 TaxID=2601041 RepID=UPI0015D3BC51|nr:hypothetical protein [Acinetobacter sp. YH12023]
MFTNNAMKNLMNGVFQKDFCLPDELQIILNEGFKKLDRGIIVFNRTFSEQFSSCEDVNSNIDKFLETFIDKSGFENFINKIHIDDYVFESVDIVNSAFIFLEKFNILWGQSFPEINCISLISFDTDNEFGLGCVFRFHVIREGSEIYDIEKIEDFIEPMAIKVYQAV